MTIRSIFSVLGRERVSRSWMTWVRNKGPGEVGGGGGGRAGKGRFASAIFSQDVVERQDAGILHWKWSWLSRSDL